MLPSDAHAATNLTSLRAPDGSDHLRDYVSFCGHFQPLNLSATKPNNSISKPIHYYESPSLSEAATSASAAQLLFAIAAASALNH